MAFTVTANSSTGFGISLGAGSTGQIKTKISGSFAAKPVKVKTSAVPVAINESQTQESGSGGYASSHTLPDLDVTGTNSYAVAAGFNRNPASDVTSWTFEGNTPDNLYDSINTNVVAVSTKGYVINNAATTIVSNTPSFKLQAMIGVALTGVNQSTPDATTGTNTTGGYGASGTLAYTGTEGNMLLVFVSTQNDRTFTASNCTEIAEVTHADGNLGSGFAGYVEATGSSQTIGATWTGDDNWRLVIIELERAGSASWSVKPVKYKTGGSFTTTGY